MQASFSLGSTVRVVIDFGCVDGSLLIGQSAVLRMPECSCTSLIEMLILLVLGCRLQRQLTPQCLPLPSVIKRIVNAAPQLRILECLGYVLYGYI